MSTGEVGLVMARKPKCVIGVELYPGDVIPCNEPASYYAHRWGYGPGTDEMPCCEHHAYEALQDDAEVTGPSGNACRIDDEGWIYEVAL